TEVPNGLIHDWLGAAFFPDMTLEQVFATMDQYACYKDFYKPLVIDSKLLSRDDKEINFSMRWFKKALWITTVMEGDYKATYFRRDEKVPVWIRLEHAHSGRRQLWATVGTEVALRDRQRFHLAPVQHFALPGAGRWRARRTGSYGLEPWCAGLHGVAGE